MLPTCWRICPQGVVKRVLEKSSKQTRESLNKLLNYPESSAGSLMTPEYVRLRMDMTVEQAFAAIRKQGENAETVYINYVVERNRLKVLSLPVTCCWQTLIPRWSILWTTTWSP